MKKIAAILLLALTLTVNASAMEVPSAAVVQNLNGSQQYVKTYTVSPETDAQTLIEDSFDYEGYTYTYASMVKTENRLEEKKPHTETVTVETAKNDLSAVLAQLAPTLDYSDGPYAGTLALDHTTIVTQAAGYAKKSYTVSEVKEIGNLDSNDLAYVPSTTLKNGVTLPLASVEWQVQGTALVDDTLVPSQYKAVATYSSRASYSAATGYISTADYVGEVVCDQVESVTYTVTYLGTKTVLAGGVKAVVASFFTNPIAVIGTLIGVAVLVVAGVLLYRLIQRKRVESTETIDEENEESEEEQK